jgi:PKD domain-containing protein
MRTRLLQALALAVLALGALVIPATAAAAPPANDDFVNAVALDPSALPFSDSVTIDEATFEAGEPAGCYTASKSVWYSITPTSDGVLRADVGNSSFIDRFVYVYRQNGSGFGGLSTVGCASPYTNGQSSVAVNVQAGTTYYIQAGGLFPFSGGTLALSVQSIPAPQNDDFAAATPVGSVPYSDPVDTTGASTQAGEPTPSCGSDTSGGTVWYAFTPSQSGSYTARAPFGGINTQVAAYAGSQLGNLNELSCRSFGQPLTFHATAGTTYYLQVGGMFGGRGTFTFTLDNAPAPVPNLFYYPSDPSTFDTVQFIDQSNDPGGNGFSSEVWDFGDGASVSNPGCCPSHRYTADGTYTARLTVTTTDGRTATAARDVVVKTHDVTITKVVVPQTASVGQTRTITVGLTNHRYPETAQVLLLKSVAGGGWQQVGVLTQYVPIRSGNRTTDFAFSYTFAPEDAQLGKVNFQAVATLQGAHDAVPSDNTFVSLPTKVNR